uniref:ABC transporter permease n=1 Tax=Candidatus Cryptobacteroides bacterium TaxID=3085639 RepID=UPI0040292B49
MKVWKYLLKKEFKQFLRDPGMPRMVLCFPFLIILVFPFAANMEVRNLSLVIVDSDQSDQSALLTEKCASSGYFKIRDVTESPSDAQAVMDRGGADAILTLSSGIARYLEPDRGT